MMAFCSAMAWGQSLEKAGQGSPHPMETVTVQSWNSGFWDLAFLPRQPLFLLLPFKSSLDQFKGNRDPVGFQVCLDPGGHQNSLLFHLSGLFDSVWLHSQTGSKMAAGIPSLQCCVSHALGGWGRGRERDSLPSNIHMTNFMKGFWLSHKPSPVQITRNKRHRSWIDQPCVFCHSWYLGSGPPKSQRLSWIWRRTHDFSMKDRQNNKNVSATSQKSAGYKDTKIPLQTEA